MLISWVHLSTLMFFQWMHVLAIKYLSTYVLAMQMHMPGYTLLVCMCTYDLLVIYFDSTMHDAHVLCINIVLVLLYMYIIIPVLLVYVWLVIWCNPCEFILMLHKPKCALAVHILSVYIYCPYLSFHYICMLSSKTIYMPVTST